MPRLPTGTVTFLFTDIEASTRLIQGLGDTASKQIFADHRRLLVEAVEAVGGSVYQDQGESFVFVFPRAKDAVLGAIVAQRALQNHAWPKGYRPRVRMGLHTGEPVSEAGEYVGLDVHRAARICSAGHGGQILLSQTTYDLVVADLPDGARVHDLGEHRLKDLTRPQHLFQVVAPDLPADFPALRSLDGLPNNLPVRLTSFVGREREKAEVKRLLATARLLTLTGSGGAGKTRLALQVAAELLEDFKDGVWVVELASVSDAALVAKAVASAMHVPEQPGRPLSKTLEDYLRPRSLLLVLDNCEHLVSACADLAESLLRPCPELRVLATSQEPLGIDGETTYSVPSLSLPDSSIFPVERMREFEAVRLFLDRAAAALPSFELSSINAQDVAGICQRLDGIPLAIELAAARVRALPIDQISERLRDRFRLLTSGSRTAPRRHQTLRAAMDWSYDLLPEAERVLLRRLSVFAGGFTLQAAEAVCQGQGVTGDDVLDLLTHLVEKSLVVFDEGKGRYRLLETVRQYGRERLLESGEEATTHRRHMDWFFALATRAEPELHASDQLVWLDRLEMEHDNLRAALEWGRASEPEMALRLAASLWWFWELHGHFSEGRRWLEAALASAHITTAMRGKGLYRAAFLHWGQGDNARAATLCDEAFELSGKLGDFQGMAFSRLIQSFVAGDLIRIVALREESLTLFRKAEDAWGTGLALFNLAGALDDRGRAWSLLEESLTQFRLLGDRWGLGFALMGQGSQMLGQGDFVRATTLYEESLSLWKELGYSWGIAAIQNGLGVLARYQGNPEKAVALHEESLTTYRHLGERNRIAASLRFLALAAHDLGDHDRAITSLQESLGMFRELGDNYRTAVVIRDQGWIARLRGDPEDAATSLKESLGLITRLGDKYQIAWTLEQLAGVAAATGSFERAGHLLGAAGRIREEIGLAIPPPYRADYHRAMSTARTGLGEVEFARAMEEGRSMTLDQAYEYALRTNG